MTPVYIYKGPPPPRERSDTRQYDPLPKGDYAFVVLQVEPPRIKEETGNKVMLVKVSIEPSGKWVWARPWAGKTRHGEERDDIYEFLNCLNALPRRGEEPDWESLIGKKGKCHLSTKTAEKGAWQGQVVNEIAYFHSPRKLVQPEEPDEDGAPDDLPF